MTYLARQALITTPANDQRPGAFSNEVLDAVIKPHIGAIQEWLRNRVPALEEAAVFECVRYALLEGRGDAFNSALALKTEANWPVDIHLTLSLHNICAAIPVAVRHAERIWQVRTGVRFPGQVGDRIQWFHENRTTTGEIVAVDKTTATAIAQVMAGKLKSGINLRVHAESVTKNYDRELGERHLGFRLIDEDESLSETDSLVVEAANS